MSSMQVDTRERGFSYAYDAPLDMRMDPEDELSAADIVNTWEERRLSTLLRDYGEERFARQIARAIVRARARAQLTTTTELVDVIKAAVPAPARFAAGHPAKRTFHWLSSSLPTVKRPGIRLARSPTWVSVTGVKMQIIKRLSMRFELE